MKTDVMYGYTRHADIKRLIFVENILKENIPPGGSVLDIGCGNGIISKYLGQKGYNILGIDADHKAISYALRNSSLPNVRFEVKSAEELSENGFQYDAIVCSEVLEHLNDPSVLLKTLHKIIKPNGVLIVTVPNGRGPRELLVTRPMQYFSKKRGLIWRIIQVVKNGMGYDGQTIQSSSENLEHIQFFTISALQKLASENNFSIVTIARSNFIDDVFPFSFVTKRSYALQKLDAGLADRLPLSWTGGFLSVWKRA